MIRPIKRKILVDMDVLPSETKSGFYLAYVTEKPKYKEWHDSPTLYGKVAAVGSKVTTVNVGDRIAFQRADSWRFEKDTKALVDESAVFAIL